MRKINYAKVFFGETRLKDIAVGATKWEVFKYKFMRATRATVMAVFALGLLYGAFFTGRVTTSPIFVNAEDKSQYMFDSKIEQLKNGVVNEILSCESAGHSEDNGIVVFDTNGKGSFGQLQFQKDTVIHYYKVLYGKTITGKEAVLIAMDTQKARDLAKDIMFSTKNKAGKDWVNCERKFSSDKQIDLIKKMQ
tara:strand:- start:421 stop:999 length:579 start_codon:yes stop_codon:yes gene_type:complete